jgi:predicted nucleic acid-binding protein
MKVFLDTNVILDVLAGRKPFVTDARAVLSQVEAGRAEGFIAAHSVTTLFYLLRRGLGKKTARRVLLDLFRVVRIVSVDEDRIFQALGMEWEEFEDAVQACCAANIEADVLLTRDRDGFRRSPVPVLSPAEFLALHGEKLLENANS